MKKISRLFFGLFLILTLCITGFACAKEPAKHTVTFMNGTTQYEQVNVTENTAVTAPSTNPTKESNVQYSYIFDGWYNGETEWDFTTPVTGNLTLTAKYTQTVNEYAVTFKNEDGSVFSTSSVAYGTVITLPATNPTKNSDTQYSYTFAGWDGYIAGMTVNGNKEFTATYSNNVNTYTITFKNEDGTVYNSYSKNYGEEITLPAINPTKSATAQYTYTFAGWTGYTDGMTVSGNVEFIANFMSTVNKYTVTFKNEDGSVFQTLEVNYGTMAGIPATSPSKDKYAFSYWETISGAQYNFNTPVTENVDLYPRFIKTVEEFTVTFTVDGVVYATVTVEQGTAIGALAPANPTKESTETIAYTFDYWRNGRTRWDIENGIVNKDITLTAKFNETPIVKPVVYYTVSFVASGEIVQSYQFQENTTAVEYPGPEKIVDDNYNYTFAGWYQVNEDGTVADSEWDFTTLLTSDVTLKAMYNRKIKPVYYETFDQETYGEDIPDYIWEREAAFGVEPDLEGFVIDGKMGDAEKWQDQKFYTSTIASTPRISYTTSTQFSDLGLYVFAQASDDAGIMHDGINYMFMNTCFTFYVTDGARDEHGVWVKQIKVDSRNVYPTKTRVKLAIGLAEGKVNSNAPAKWNVEFFITWKDLGINQRPDTIKMYTDYQYKNVAGSNIVYHLKSPFAGDLYDLSSYVIYDENGYSNSDAENAVIGESVYGVAKTNGWDISNENKEEDSYVLATTNTTNLAFFRTEDGSSYGDYYSFETTIEPNVLEIEGGLRAGLAIYKSDTIYSFFFFDINPKTWSSESGFSVANARIRRGNLDKSVTNINIPTQLEIQPDTDGIGRIHTKILFANSYIYYIVNDKLIYCEYVDSLNINTMPGLVSFNKDVKFSDYKFTKYTEYNIAKETKKYAFVVDASSIRFKTTGVDGEGNNYVPTFAYNDDDTIKINGANQFVDQYGNRYDVEDKSLTIEFDAIGVSSDASANEIHMTLNHAVFSPDNNAIKTIKSAAATKGKTPLSGVGKFVPRIKRVFKNEKINVYEDPNTNLTINEYKGYEITDDFFANNDEGVYALRNIKSDTSVRFEMEDSKDENLVALYTNLVNINNIQENANINTVAKVYSDNPNYGIVNTNLSNGELVLAVEKGYRYRLVISSTGYRNVYYDVNGGDPVTESMCIGEEMEIQVEVGNNIYETQKKWCLMATPNVIGGVCTSADSESSFFKDSAAYSKKWDFASDAEGYSIFSHLTNQLGGGGEIFFTGKLAGYVQYAECVFSNITDVYSTSSKIEVDPTVGFCIATAKATATIALRYNGIRYLDGITGFAGATHWTGYKNNTVGVFPKENDDGTITYTKTKIGLLRIYDKAYVYIGDADDKNMELFCQIDLEDFANAEAAIGIKVATTYVTQIRAEDYFCIEGDDAYDKAIELLGVDVQLGKSCFDREDKPYIEVSGKRIIDFRDENKDDVEVVFWNDEIIISVVEENIETGIVFAVTVGDYTTIISKNNPTAKFVIDKSFDPAVGITCEPKGLGGIVGEIRIVDKYGNPQMVEKLDEYGNPVLDENDNPIMVEMVASNVSGKLIDTKTGAVINFTTDAEGKYIVEGEYNTSYDYELQLYGYYTESYVVKTALNPDQTAVTANVVILHEAEFGSNITQGNNELVSTKDGVKLGYHNTKYGIEGPLFEIEKSNGGVSLNYHEGLVGDFDLKFSYYRVTSNSTSNAELDPGIGITLTNGKGDQDVLYFLKNGYRVLPAGSDFNEKHEDSKKWNGNVVEAGYLMDLRFIRKGETIYMFAKLHTEEEYTFVYSYTSTAGLGKAVLAISTSQTNGKLNHYFFSNIELKHLTEADRVEDLEVDVNVTVEGEGEYVMHPGSGYEGAYILSESNKIEISPAEGWQVAYVKVNGEFADVIKNVVYFTNAITNDIQVVFEEPPQIVSITGKIEYEEDLPDTITVVGKYIEDGRIFQFSVRVNENGEFIVDNIRVGSFMFAIIVRHEVATYSEEIEILVPNEGSTMQDIGVFSPTVYIPHEEVVNGYTLPVNNNLTSDIESVANDDVRWDKTLTGGANYLKVINSKDKEFYIETDVTMDLRNTANLSKSDSKYACDDEVNGFTIDNGKNIFAVMFCNDNGLRITSTGGYSGNGGMIQTTGNPAFPRDGGEKTRKLAIMKAFVEETQDYVYKIYIDGTLYYELSEKAGIVCKNNAKCVEESWYEYETAKENVKTWMASLNTSNELAIGFRCNTYGGSSGRYCAAGYSNTKIVTNAEKIAEYKAILE